MNLSQAIINSSFPGLYAGNYGWDHAAYWGIAEAKAGVDLKEWYKTRTKAPKGRGGGWKN